MRPSLRHNLFHASFAIIDRARLDRLFAPIARGRGAILMFHHVRPWTPRDFAPNRLLEITPDFLDETLTQVRREGFDIIPLDQVPDRLASPRERPFAAITFDDGYRDNAIYAEPILRRHQAPWTVFVATDFAAGQGRLWWLELEEAIRRLPRIGIRADGLALDLPAATPAEKERAFHTIYWRLRAGSEERLLSAIAELVETAALDTSSFVSDLCLNFSELSALAAAPGVSIGGHTVSHRMLAKHDDAVVRRELTEGRAILEARLGRPVRAVAYPVGDASAAGTRDFGIAREAGYQIGVTTRPGHVFASHRAHMQGLPRVSVNGHHQNSRAVRALLSGLPFLAWNRGRRVAMT